MEAREKSIIGFVMPMIGIGCMSVAPVVGAYDDLYRVDFTAYAVSNLYRSNMEMSIVLDYDLSPGVSRLYYVWASVPSAGQTDYCLTPDGRWVDSIPAENPTSGVFGRPEIGAVGRYGSNRCLEPTGWYNGEGPITIPVVSRLDLSASVFDRTDVWIGIDEEGQGGDGYPERADRVYRFSDPPSAMSMAEDAGVGPGDNPNRAAQTARMAGTWEFERIEGGVKLVTRYSFDASSMIYNTADRGRYYLVGAGADGNRDVRAGYSPLLRSFTIVDPENIGYYSYLPGDTTPYDYYDLYFWSEGNFTGCYYSGYGSDYRTMSACIPVIGRRID